MPAATASRTSGGFYPWTGGAGGAGGGGAGAGFDGNGGGAGASAVSSAAGIPLVVAGGGGGAARSSGLGGMVGGAGGLPAGGNGGGSGGPGGLANGAGGAGVNWRPVHLPGEVDEFAGAGGGVGTGGSPNGGSGAGGVGGGGGGTVPDSTPGNGGDGGTGTGQPAAVSGAIPSAGAGNSTGGNGGPGLYGGGGGGGGIGFGGGGGGISGGGGGAGYGGGAGGANYNAQQAGGGGGSSYVIPTASSSAFVASTLAGDGLVKISYDPDQDQCPAAPVACQPGFYSATGNAPCTAAAKGYFVDTPGATAQTPCPSGTTSTVTGATACVHINQAPSFVKGSDQVVLANAAAQTVSPWATAISAGPASESGQRLDFTVTNDNNPLFSAQPSVDVDGTLHFTPAANQTGVANVSVTLRDDGGTDAGGVDTSATQQFTITVNQAPSFAPGTSPPLTASVGQPYGYPFVATGYPTTITYSLVGAPAWLSIDAQRCGGRYAADRNDDVRVLGEGDERGRERDLRAVHGDGRRAAAAHRRRRTCRRRCRVPTSAKVGVNTTCTLTVRNAGPAVAKNVWVALALPSSLTRVSNTGNAVWWRNLATWPVGSLNANASATYTITFKARTAGKAIIGAATASISPDPNWKNNVAAASLTITK